MTETLLYGCKIGDPDYMEEILYKCRGYVNRDDLILKGRSWAKKNGYDRLRVSIVDLTKGPDFTISIQI